VNRADGQQGGIAMLEPRCRVGTSPIYARFASISWSCAILALLLLAAPPAGAQELQIDVYGDLRYSIIHEDPADDSPGTNENQFSLPTLDIFFNASARKISFLAEMLFDIPEDANNEFEVDIDRLQVTYHHSELLQATVGRIHTAIGYFNTAFPHGGAIFLVPVHRPAFASQFEEDSLLPTLCVGLNLHGRIPAAGNSLFYDFEVGNGRGPLSDNIPNLFDSNDSKSLNLRLEYEISDFILGANAYLDWIPPRDEDPVQPDTMREQIFGAHLAYVEYPYHLIGEFAFIQHVGDDDTFSTSGGLAEVGYGLKNIMPYARFEFAAFPDETDPFWAATVQQARGDYEVLTGGVKWTVSEDLAIKFELELDHADTDTAYEAISQAAFAF
jgi:hypothetical protein